MKTTIALHACVESRLAGGAESTGLMLKPPRCHSQELLVAARARVAPGVYRMRRNNAKTEEKMGLNGCAAQPYARGRRDDATRCRWPGARPA